MKQIKLVLVLFFLALSGTALMAQKPNETKGEYNQRMKWWDDGRMGMFIHWGVYSTFGGEYNGQDYGKDMGQCSAEWIYLKADIPEKVYHKAAQEWNPYKFNADEWVKMAKDAGMKYMVLTSKHHDGYALFDSKVSDWNVVKCSAIKKDLVKEFVAACNKYNMKVGFYYSHEKDWTNHVKKASDKKPLSKEYIEFAKKQITELLTQYGKIDLIWFDTPVSQHKEFNKMCAGLVRKYQPECIINGRIGNGLGDYKNIGDRTVVDPGLSGYMESIMTMRLNWGYDNNDDCWKSSDEVIKMISHSVCRGSNFLLNVGPKPNGEITLEDQVRLHEIGQWIKSNGEAIYQTKGSPFSKEFVWGSLTRSKDKNIIYLHLQDWTGGNIVLKGLMSKVKDASFLDTGEKLNFIQNDNNEEVTIKLPLVNTSTSLRIVKLNLDGKNFDTSNGPDFLRPRISDKWRSRIFGKVTNVKGIHFSVIGRKVINNKNGSEILKNTLDTLNFTLTDKSRFRKNDGKNIYTIESIELKEGVDCNVVYNKSKKGLNVEIFTERY